MRLIDADKLIHTIEHDVFMGKSVRSFVGCLVKGAPTVDPAKHGRWKPFDLTWGRSIYYCTSCGGAGEVPTEMGKPIYEYCPYCGAKMDEVEE